MNILFITAGAANMYCGSCLMDNALARELIVQGHAVTLIPLYTPTRTDEPNVSQERVFFGGISVYLEQYVPFLRRAPRWLDRLWDSQWALKLAARRSVAVDPHLLGALTVSMLRGEAGHQQKEFTKLLDWLRTQDLPDVINLPYTLLIGLAAPLKEALGRPVCCTLQGEEIFLNNLLEPYRSTALELIRAKVKDVDAFLPVSQYCADFMGDYLGIPREKLHVAPLGINFEGHELRPPRSADQFTIGFFGRVAPEKGLHLLCAAYRQLRGEADFPPARLEVAGYLAPEHRAYLARLERQMAEWGFGAEFHYRGVLERDEKIAFLQQLDVLSIPATYDDPKGIVLLEAMANGVPVVVPRRGTFTEVVERTGGGLLVEPENCDSLAAGIRSLARNPALAAKLGQQGYDGVRRHFSIHQMAERVQAVYRGLLTARSTSSANLTVAELI